MYTLQTASKDFLSHCQFEKNLSPKTLKAYEIDLRQLLQFLLEKEYSSEIISIAKIQLREYLEEISILKPKSIKRKIATVKAMFNYLEYEDSIIVNPFRKMRISIKEPKNLPKVLNIDEVEKIFKTAYDRKEKEDTSTFVYLECLRDIVVVELLFATGARVSEIANLKHENINLTNGSVTLKGKGSKERIIQICNEETLTVLQTYYAFFSQKILASGNYFLINRLGNKLSDQSIRTIVKNITNTAKISRHITPHVFRHSFATLLLEEDVDIKYIQQLLGHSSIITTQIYTHVNREKQKQILTTKHPRKNFHM